MAHIIRVARKAKGGRARQAWKVRYRDPDRVEKAKTFATKIEAERFAAGIETDKVRGEYIDPNAGKLTLAGWAEDWLSTVADPKTREGYESVNRRHILPRFGSRSLASIRTIDVQRFVNEIPGAPRTVGKVKTQLGTILNAAVTSGLIARNPVRGVKVPRVVRREMAFLTAQQVAAVASNVPDRYRSFVYLLAYGGLRWGEAAALRRGRCNLLRSRVEVSEAVSEVRGALHYGSTKTYQVRSVALPAFLRDLLAQHLAAYTDEGARALVFTTDNGGPLRLSNFRQRVWWPALEAAGLPKSVRIHDLRHTAASLLIAQGAHPKAIQRHLGHSSISVTLDTYGHLLPDEQDRIANALDETFKAAKT